MSFVIRGYDGDPEFQSHPPALSGKHRFHVIAFTRRGALAMAEQWMKEMAPISNLAYVTIRGNKIRDRWGRHEDEQRWIRKLEDGQKVQITG